MFLAAGLRLLLGQLAHLLLDVADLPLEPLVLLLLSVFAVAALVSLLRQLLQVLLDAGHKALHREGVKRGQGSQCRNKYTFDKK